jgi:hypothetical protein
MKLSRREMLALAAASPLQGQGVATRNVKQMPRGKPSGIPFLAQFIDVAASAGLSAPVIYGGVSPRGSEAIQRKRQTVSTAITATAPSPT